jgi:alpha-1,3-glucosyltransferase
MKSWHYPNSRRCNSRSRLFLQLATITLSTFIVLFLPWLPPFAAFSSITQPVIRIFPFARGLFEDKVANFWCATNVVVKWKSRMSSGTLVKLSTLFTAIGFLPSVIGLLRAAVTMSPPSAENRKIDSEETKLTPQKLNVSCDTTPFLPLLPYALLTSSMSFFLFSFQVHEKTILLPLLPMTLLLSGANVNSTVYQWGVLFNNVAVFRWVSMLMYWSYLFLDIPFDL